jgi:1-pyrroline-5-carboxylate dehydrogenase
MLMSTNSVSYTSAPEAYEPLQQMLDERLPTFQQSLERKWANRIAGSPSWDGTLYNITSPIDAKISLGTFVDASEAAVAAAVKAARDAAPKWGRLPWQERVACLRNVAREIEARKIDLALASLFEVGKTRTGALGEVQEAVELIEYYCTQMENNNGYTQPLSTDRHEPSVSKQRPYGVFGVIAPFNFPVALSVNMLSAAMVAGNTVVYKPSPGAGLSGCLLTEAFEAAGIPAGVFNLICGPSAGQKLVGTPGVDGIAFTGSHKAGMEIHERMAAGDYARPVIAEMGGKNPVYISASAELPIAVKAVLRSAFGMQGQMCTACSVAYVHESLIEEFVARLSKGLELFSFGDTSHREITHGPLINEAAYNRFSAAVDDAKREGAVLSGGARFEGDAYDRGYYVQPTIVTNLPDNHRLFTDELFAPLLVVSPFRNLEDAIERGNAVPLGLSAGFYGKDQREIDIFLERAEAGVLNVNRLNGATTGAWPGRQSFCGWKGSGLTGKGGLGPHFVLQFMREQSHTIQH